MPSFGPDLFLWSLLYWKLPSIAFMFNFIPRQVYLRGIDMNSPSKIAADTPNFGNVLLNVHKSFDKQ